MITYNEVIGIHNNNRNNDESIIEDEEKSCGNVDMDSDCSQKGKPDEAEKDPDYVLNSQNSSDDDDKLDVRKFRHKYIFDRLITTFLDDEDDDSNNLAFSQDPYWE